MGKTYSLVIQESQAEITALNITPEDLVGKLSKKSKDREAADLLVFGERHDEYAIREKLAQIIEANKNPISSFYAEYDKDRFQTKFNAYTSADPNPNKKYMERISEIPTEAAMYLYEMQALARQNEERTLNEIATLSSHAPSEDKPEERKSFFKAQADIYRVVKSDRMKLICYDGNEDGAEEFIDKAEDLEKKYEELKWQRETFSQMFVDKKYAGAKMTPAQYAELVERTDKHLNTLYEWKESIASHYLDAQEYHEAYVAYCEDICQQTGHKLRGQPFKGALRFENQFVIESASALIKIENEVIVANEELCRVRNPIMSQNILEQVYKDKDSKPVHEGHSNVGVVLVGSAHFIDTDERVGSMVQMIKDKSVSAGKKLNVVTIDIVPTDKETIDKMGQVFIGGRNGADFTIFVEGKLLQEELSKISEISFERSNNAKSPFNNLSDEKPVPTKTASIEEIYKEQYLATTDKKNVAAVNPLAMVRLQQGKTAGIEGLS